MSTAASPDRSSAEDLQKAVARLREAEQSRTWRDALRCAVGRHRAAVSIHYGLTLQRCSCGAKRLGPGRPWLKRV